MVQISNVSPHTNSVGTRGERKIDAPVRIVFIGGKAVYPVFFEIDFSKDRIGKDRDSKDEHWEPPTSWTSLSDD